VTFYSKTYSDSRSRDQFRFLQAVHEQLAAQPAAAIIPRPLLHLDDVNTFWQEDWLGNPLINVLADCDWKNLFPRIAWAIATLHRSRIKGLPLGPSLDGILMRATTHQAKIASSLPEHELWTRTVIKRLTDAKDALQRTEIPTVPIHGAFRVEQILTREGELALVDFDDVALGDPLYDVAQFIASLQYLEFSQGRQKEKLAKAVDEFYSSYAEQVKWTGDRRRVAWYVLALFVSKMYYSSKNLDVMTVRRLDRIQDTVDEWLKWARPPHGR
jgi:thiamine kinase-like enzyme